VLRDFAHDFILIFFPAQCTFPSRAVKPLQAIEDTEIVGLELNALHFY